MDDALLAMGGLWRLYALWRTLYRARCYMGEYNATRAFHAWRREAYAASARRIRASCRRLRVPGAAPSRYTETDSPLA